jgi:hypothetical protein
MSTGSTPKLAPLNPLAIHCISIPEQVLWRGLPRKGLDELTRRPLGGRMLGHIEVDDFPSRVRQDDQHEENLEADRRHGKEVEGDELRQVVLEEGPSRG